jgi:hypothetical protein
MTSSEDKKCRDCEFKAPVDEWAVLSNGMKKVLCVDCAFRYCTRCDFKAPLKTWKIKAGGVPGKWCEKCCAWSKQKEKKIRDEKREVYDSDDY